MWLLDSRMAPRQVVLVPSRDRMCHLTCGMVVLLVQETEWVVANMKEMIWLRCVSQT
jgi:hypothetical protein